MMFPEPVPGPTPSSVMGAETTTGEPDLSEFCETIRVAALAFVRDLAGSIISTQDPERLAQHASEQQLPECSVLAVMRALEQSPHPLYRRLREGVPPPGGIRICDESVANCSGTCDGYKCRADHTPKPTGGLSRSGPQPSLSQSPLRMTLDGTAAILGSPTPAITIGTVSTAALTQPRPPEPLSPRRLAF